MMIKETVLPALAGQNAKYLTLPVEKHNIDVTGWTHICRTRVNCGHNARLFIHRLERLMLVLNVNSY
jgi:hypothetical protein